MDVVIIRIFIYEHITGGGIHDQSIDSTLFPEGFAMLNAVVEDFRDLGEEIITTIDSRLVPIKHHIHAHVIEQITGENFHDTFERIAADSDIILLIAPEFQNILYNLATRVEKAGRLLLGPSAGAIRITTDKAETQKKALEAHVLVPSGIRVSFSEQLPIIDKICSQIGYPVVFKPIDGVGGAGICIVATSQDISAALDTVRHETTLDTFHVQKFISGLDVSVSVIGNSKSITPISLNAQLMRLAPPGSPSQYHGGYLPISHPLKEEAFANCQKVLNYLKGFRGYIGLDFVFSYAPFLIEINPRITTSYLGLREVLSPSPARLILDAAFDKPLKQFTFSGAAIYTKVTLTTELHSIEIPPEFQNKIKISAPPFPMGGQSTIFLVAYANSIKEAQETMDQFKYYLSYRLKQTQ